MMAPNSATKMATMSRSRGCTICPAVCCSDFIAMATHPTWPDIPLAGFEHAPGIHQRAKSAPLYTAPHCDAQTPDYLLPFPNQRIAWQEFQDQFLTTHQ